MVERTRTFNKNEQRQQREAITVFEASRPLRFLSDDPRKTNPLWIAGKYFDGLGRELVDRSLSVDQAGKAITEANWMRSYYPRLEVPEDFPAERPSILFSSFVPYKPRSISPEDPNVQLYQREIDSGIQNLDIINVDNLREAFSKVLQFGAEPDITARYITGLITRVFIDNLEIHRLTADPDGTVMRFGNPEEENIDESQLYELPSHSGLPPYGFWDEITRNKDITYWHRRNNLAARQYMGKTHLRLKTIRQLEETHFITLDEYEDMAVSAISK